MSKDPVFCSILKQISDDHQCPDAPFVGLADFKAVLEKARKRTLLELRRKTQGSLEAKLLNASTALRAYRNRHLGTLNHCCEAWEPVGKCFDQCSFEYTDFHGLSQIIESLTRDGIAEREGEICNPWTQTEKRQCLGEVQARSSRLALQEANALSPRGLPMKTVTFWEMKTSRAGGYVNIGARSLRRVSKASGTIAMRLSCDTFRRLVTTYGGILTEMNLMNSWPKKKKESAPGPDAVPESLCRCAGGMGSQFSFNAFKHVLECGPVPAQFAASRTVFISKSSDVDNNGLIVRSPEALRPLTLCNCDCKILTTAICRGLQWYIHLRDASRPGK